MSVEDAIFEKPTFRRENLEKLEGLILTNEQYREHPFAHSEEPRAYVFELRKGSKIILYFGSNHISDPQDPMYRQIAEKFSEINPDMVYIEGMQKINTNNIKVRERILTSTLDSTKLEGENSFTLKLAVDAGIDFESPEPEFAEELAHLLHKGFSKQNIFNYYMYRDIDQYQRMHKNRDAGECERDLKSYIRYFRTISAWNTEEVDYFEQDVLSHLNVDDESFYHIQVDPIPWEGNPQTVINEISRGSSSFRDNHIFQRITQGLKTHNRIFIVYGSAHAVKQEPALRALINTI
jgi:hypothetical protein